MNQNIKLAQSEDLETILRYLRQRGVRNSYAIQDLTVWFQSSKFYYSLDNDQLSYVLLTGHPAAQGLTTVVMDGEPEAVAEILKHLALKSPFLIRETRSVFLPVIQAMYPDAKVYLEQRMDVTKESFNAALGRRARSLSVNDALSVAQFFGAPPQAADRFVGWLRGAKAFFAVFEEGKIVSIGSSMVTVPEAWNIVGIQTLKEARGKGYAPEVVSALVERALQETQTVTLTVVKENASAIRAYEKVGFKYAEDRIWVDCGAGAAP